MEQAGLRKSIYINWVDSGLASRAQVTIEDNTTGTPAAVVTLPVTEWKPGIYLASFVPAAQKSYLVTGQVFTDGAFTTLDANYAASAQEFGCVDLLSQSFEETTIFEDESEDDVLFEDEGD